MADNIRRRDGGNTRRQLMSMSMSMDISVATAQVTDDVDEYVDAENSNSKSFTFTPTLYPTTTLQQKNSYEMVNDSTHFDTMTYVYFVLGLVGLIVLSMLFHRKRRSTIERVSP